MRTVKEVSRLTGVSVRTLHHYHAIGLLEPSRITPAGYRLYDDRALGRLQMILLFRELEFPLAQIKDILDSPGFDQKLALSQQIRLLELRRDRLGQIIDLARELLENGGTKMDFTAFDDSELQAYAKEAKEKWGGTEAYREFQEKAREQGDFSQASQILMACFEKLGRLKHLDPDGPEAQAWVEELRETISGDFYRCTPEILQGLGQMYTGDDRFRANIDKAGGDGTAEFASRAIAAYCRSARD